jgi:archaemetzincin
MKPDPTTPTTPSRRHFLQSGGLCLAILRFSDATAADPTAPLIRIQPLGPVRDSVTKTAVAAVERTFRARVEVLKSVPLPPEAWYAPRSRHRAEKLLDFLQRETPEPYFKVIGITEGDISTTKNEHPDWGIFGLGSIDGKTGVISTHRLKSNGASEEKAAERLAKIVIHETGHTLGLPHCPEAGCVMGDAHGTIASVDDSGEQFCAACQKRIALHLRSR